jgi:hypothetical protein
MSVIAIEGFPGRMSSRGVGRLCSSKTHHTAASNRSVSASLTAVICISADAEFDMGLPLPIQNVQSDSNLPSGVTVITLVLWQPSRDVLRARACSQADDGRGELLNGDRRSILRAGHVADKGGFHSAGH